MAWGRSSWTDESSCSSVDFEEEVTTLEYQAGRVEVGGKDEDGEESMRWEIEFNRAFNEGVVPVVFVCPEGEVGRDCKDVFGVTVIENTISNSGFHVNVGRMAKRESYGWGQNLSLNWLAVDSTSPLLQAVVVDVGSKDDEGDESKGVEVRFPRPFPGGAKPAVFATAYGQDYPDTFAVCCQHSSKKRAHLNVCRGVGGGWGQNLRVAVLATTMFPAQMFELGGVDDDGERDKGFEGLTFPEGGLTKRRPCIFTCALHQAGSRYPDAFVCSPGNVTAQNFQLNIQRGNPECHGWGQNVRVQAILIP